MVLLYNSLYNCIAIVIIQLILWQDVNCLIKHLYLFVFVFNYLYLYLLNFK